LPWMEYKFSDATTTHKYGITIRIGADLSLCNSYFQYCENWIGATYLPKHLNKGGQMEYCRSAINTRVGRLRTAEMECKS